MKTQIKLAGMLCASAIFLASCGNGANGDEATDTMSMREQMGAAVDSVQNAIVDPNKDFVRDAVRMNKKEMAWLDAGMKHGTNAEVKANAKMMMADHEKLGMEVMDYAASKGIELPDVDTAGEADLNENKGKDWDRKWAEQMVDDHQKVIDRFERARENVTDESLKNMVTNALPTLRKHFEMTQKLRDKLTR